MSFPQSPQGEPTPLSFDAPPAPPAPPGLGQGNSEATRAGQTNVLAILSLVFAFVFAPAGLVLGFVARKQIKTSREEGAGLALAGIIVSAAQIVLGVALVIFYVVVIAMLGSSADHTGDLIREGGSATGAPAPAPTGSPVAAQKSAEADALAMVKAQEAYRRVNPGVPGYGMEFVTKPVGVGTTTVTPSPGNEISVLVAHPSETVPDGGYCVMVTSQSSGEPVMWDSAVDGGAFLGQYDATDPQVGACLAGMAD